jgi:uncharacterized protein (DUF2147 family)
MKRLFLIFISLIICHFSFASDGRDVFGYWKSFDMKTGKPEAIVLIYENNNRLYGKAVKLLPGMILELKEINEYPPLCKLCPDEFKNKPIVGLDFIYGLRKSGDVWKDGKILDPKTGKTYDAKIWVDKNNPNILLVRGYVGPFFRTQKWQRVTSPDSE